MKEKRCFISRLYREEKGSVAVITILGLVAILAFTALAIDSGYMYARHTRLQDVADACALAACIDYVETKGNANKALNKAWDYADKNGLQPSDKKSNGFKITDKKNGETGLLTLDCSVNNKGTGKNATKTYTVVSNINMNIHTFFAGVLGHNSFSIGADATASSGRAGSQSGNLVPISFFWETPPSEEGKEYILSLAPNFDASLIQDGVVGGESGNYGYLNYDDPSKFDYYIEHGYQGTLVIPGPVNTYPGASVGLVDQALDNRVARCTDGCTWDNHLPDCPRVVYIPIVDDFFKDIHGNTVVHLSGICKFFVNAYDKPNKRISGYYLSKVENTSVIGESSDYLVSAVHLVD